MASELVDVKNVSKRFDGHEVLKDLSFTVQSGEILGLIGPNGAGKTTAIRILLGIIPADSGSVAVFGLPFGEGTKNSVGYLPEERGLYMSDRVIGMLTYLASLKGMEERAARDLAMRLLDEFGLGGNANSKVNELSKGMQQKVQLISTILHGPKLVIFDEPFSGLDPMNTELIRQKILELRGRGAGIILSTHQMELAERMCDRVLMINMGRQVLYGTLGEVKSRFGKNSIKIRFSGRLPKNIPGAEGIADYGNYAEITLGKAVSANAVLERLMSSKLEMTGFELSELSLNEIFKEIVKNE